jgi:hypothetical protein
MLVVLGAVFALCTCSDNMVATAFGEGPTTISCYEGGITGTVSDFSGSPIDIVAVPAGLQDLEDNDEVWGTSVPSGSSYSLCLPPGTYNVGFSSIAWHVEVVGFCSGTVDLFQWYNGDTWNPNRQKSDGCYSAEEFGKVKTTAYASATPVIVQAGKVVPGIDGSLPEAPPLEQPILAPPPQQQEEKPERGGVASLGDSYSSGEGAGDYDPGAGLCHRSASAWPRLLQRYNPKISDTLLACSGSRSEGLEGIGEHQVNQLAELAALSPEPSLITVTMGGNDVGFSGVVEDCILEYELRKDNCVSDGRVAATDALLGVLEGLLVDDYTKILKNERQGRLLVVDYPLLLPAKQSEVRGCSWLYPVVRERLNALETRLDAVIESAASRAGALFVDVSDAFRFSHHELCSRDPWVRRPEWRDLTLRQTRRVESIEEIIDEGLQELVHPTWEGQFAIAKIVSAFITSNRLVEQ